MIENIELTELKESDNQEKVFGSKDLELCGHIKTTAQIILANAELSLDELFSLKKGGLIKTNQDINEPAMLVLNGKAIASGRLVIDSDCFAFEIVEVKGNL